MWLHAFTYWRVMVFFSMNYVCPLHIFHWVLILFLSIPRSSLSIKVAPYLWIGNIFSFVINYIMQMFLPFMKSNLFYLLVFIILLILTWDMFIDFKEREWGRERNRCEEHQLVAFHMHPNWGLICSVGMCPITPQPFGIPDNAPTN